MTIGRIIFFFIFIIVIFGGMNFYAGSRLFQWLNHLFPHLNRLIYTCIFVFVASSFIFARLPLPAGFRGVISWIGAHWMGLLVYLFLCFFLADIIVFAGKIVKLVPVNLLPNVRFFAKTAAIILAIGMVCYGLYNANKIKIVSYDVRLNKSLSEKIIIVLIADLHLGDKKSEKHLKKIIREINNLDPDIVCIAGDIFNDNYSNIRNPGAASELFKSIRAAYGVYACFGNHDGGKTFNEMTDFLERSNVKLLKEQHVIIDDRLVLIGRLDSSPIGGAGELCRGDFSGIISRVNKNLEELNLTDKNLPVAVLDHNPGNIQQYGSEADLILSGHTHRGQMFPGNLITGRLYTVDYGHYQKDSGSPHVIVTQGVNTWMMPMRVGTSNEIVSIMLY